MAARPTPEQLDHNSGLSGSLSCLALVDMWCSGAMLPTIMSRLRDGTQLSASLCCRARLRAATLEAQFPKATSPPGLYCLVVGVSRSYSDRVFWISFG